MSARRLDWAWSALIALGVVPGCSGSREDEQPCFDQYAAAAVVVVVDATGAAVGDARVTSSKDGASPREATCHPGPLKPCSEWWIDGQAGTYVIRATSADGARAATQTVAVPESGCEPDTRHVTMTLP
ncbi:MAG: hypothetical protein IT374_24935 [Polyangiaceae bacterium]|nr:hypothetical protein [Polyangiaceae bacterium]